MTDKSDKEPTPKQLAFAEHIAMGCNPSDAYRAAGYKADKPETVATEAYRLLHHPKISPIIDQMKREAMEGAVTTRRTLLDRLEAVNRKAYEELTAEGSTVSPAAFRAFMDSYSELMKGCPDDDWYSIANAEYSAQNSGSIMPVDFYGEHVWFKSGTTYR